MPIMVNYEKNNELSQKRLRILNDRRKDVGSIQKVGGRYMHSGGTLTSKKGQLCNLKRGTLYTNL